MVTADKFTTIGLPLGSTDEATVLTVNSAFEWVKSHTILEFDIDDTEALKALPSAVKLFVLKYVDIMSLSTGVTSESLGGMSQSFDTSATAALLWQYAQELLGDWLKSQVSVFPAKKKW